MRYHLLILLFAFSGNLTAQTWSPAGEKFKTKWAAQVTPENVWKEYPRPQLERADWINLNGLWEYALLEKKQAMPHKYEGQILVPFCIESALSGVAKAMLPENRLWYKREFQIPAAWSSKNVVLNFEAVDYATSVWVNGALVGSHKGAYDRFSFDISPYLNPNGKQELVVCVDDPSSSEAQPRGKQRLMPGGIMYTPVSGIWQTVWLEAVSPEVFIKEIRITPDIDKNRVRIVPFSNKPVLPGYKVNIQVSENEKVLKTSSVNIDKSIEIEIPNQRLWSPDDPFLYKLKLTLVDKNGAELDVVNSYFGMRKISLGDLKGNKYLFLNNEPLFHYGTLDQGWWPDGLHTPPSDEAMKFDIDITKQMGFNMIRKHVKIEPDRWYYHCDKLGMLVWQDMPSGTASIPIEGTTRQHSVPRTRKGEPDANRRSESTAQFEWELRRMMDLHINAPSIVVWVPFNEGWGQYATNRIAAAIKAYDPTRLVNSASGWALRPSGDIYDIHTYQTELTIAPISIDRATVIGEFGGIGYPVKGHLWNPEMRNWGYQTYHNEKDLTEHYKLKFNQIVEMKKNKGLSAAVYTQTTDVEGEVNGLITYDRELIKIPIDTLMNMHKVLFEKDEK
jgi:beta-galactosidase/beta-glucuronidase